MSVSPIIVIFAYNRPKHLNRLLSSINLNKIQTNQKILFFCDGPKSTSDKKKINQIKEIIKSSKLKFYKTIFRKKNIGLSKNIIDGVTKSLKFSDKCIVLEDDLIINNKTINYMNKMLKYFEKDRNIGSISAYSYLNYYKKFKKNNFYVSKRHCSWCWGTWRRVWKKIIWNKKNYNSHFKSKESLDNFSLGGNDLNLLLWGQQNQYIDSWAIRFNFYCSQNKLDSIQPRYSMVKNEGKDLSGTHERISLKKGEKNNFYPKINSRKSVLNNLVISRKINDYIMTTHRKSYKLRLRYLIKHKKLI